MGSTHKLSLAYWTLKHPLKDHRTMMRIMLGLALLPAFETATTTIMPSTLAPAPVTTTMTALDSSASSNSGDSSASFESFGSGPRDSSSGYSSGSFNQGSWASDSSGSASSGSTASGSWGSQLPIWLWILLICLCCCCHGGGIGAMMGGKGKPKKKKTKKVAPGSTTSTKAVAKGATSMQVASDAGFKIGDTVDIAPGTPEQEVNTVKAFGSIIFATPLQFDHPAGTKVVKAAKPAAPAPVPAAVADPVVA